MGVVGDAGRSEDLRPVEGRYWGVLGLCVLCSAGMWGIQSLGRKTHAPREAFGDIVGGRVRNDGAGALLHAGTFGSLGMILRDNFLKE